MKIAPRVYLKAGMPVDGLNLGDWKPWLGKPFPEDERVECDDLAYSVGYRQGFAFHVVAVFSDAEDADCAADALNAREGFQTYTVAKLVQP